MRQRIVLTILASAVSLSAFAQTMQVGYQPSFFAVVVKDLDNAVGWYQSVFDLKVKNRMADEKGGYKIAILESSVLTLELLELKGSLIRNQLLEAKPRGTQIQGHFKMGFHVADMDQCLRQLASLHVKVPQIWTDDVTRKRNFLVSDPDDNLIQFFE